MIGVVTLMRKLWRVWFSFIFLTTFLLLFPFFFVLLQRRAWFRYAFVLKKVWARIILLLTGIRYQITYEEKPDPHAVYVICPNHASYLDIILSPIAVPNYFHFMGKAELGRIPLFRIFFKRMNIAVERNNVRDRHRAFVRAAGDIDQGVSVLMFPEGTIPNVTPRLGRFKSGPFRLAIEKQVPVLPVTFMDNWQILPDGRKSSHGGRPICARIVVHKPVSTTGLNQDAADDLKNHIFEILNTTLRSHGSKRRND